MSGKAPRLCAACGERPVAFTEPWVDFCYQCLPGGPFTPPPCRRCGSTRDYYSAGLCARCHKYGPGRVPLKPCPECYCWGIPATWSLPCQGCQAWHRKQHAVAACARCGRNASLDKEMTCRLCRRQPGLGGRQEERGGAGWHQLFFNISFHSWPLTANPHLFINQQNATRTSAAQADWITKRLGISAQAIREDRILDEAQATRGDVRRLIALFGLSVEGAQRYTATVSHPAIGRFADGENGGP